MESKINLTVKLYRISNSIKEYWETWENIDGSYTIHWGELGTMGDRASKGAFLKKPEKIIIKKIAESRANGFTVFDGE